MNKVYAVLVVIFFFYGSLISQEKDTKKLNDAKILLLEEKLKILEDRNNFYSNVIQSVAVVNSSWANYFTLISIFIGIVTIMIPIAGYFIVIKPTRELKKKVKSLDRAILDSVEKNFEIYIERYEESRIKRAIEMLFDSNTRSSAIDILFLCDSKYIDEDAIKRIIEFLSQDIELDEMQMIIIQGKLEYSGSILVEKYYKKILESNNKTYLKYAMHYFANSSMKDHLSYLERILVASEQGYDLLIELIKEIEKKYIGDLFARKTNESVELGKQKINFLLNSNLLTERLMVPTESTDIYGNFFTNPNKLSWFPFYKETLFHRTHFAKITNEANQDGENEQ